MNAAIQNRYDFVYLFDVTDGNPNGDPDAGNLPRVDAETGQGLVTDVCLKRKVRNYVQVPKDDGRYVGARYKVFIREKAVLNQLIEEAYTASPAVKAAVGAWQKYRKDKKKQPRPDRPFEDVARDWLCENYYDIRTFGAVLSTGDEKSAGGEDADTVAKIKMTAGQVRGPVQLTIARSIDPVSQAGEFTITRCAVTNEKDLEKERTMGRKFAIPYGLYRASGYINATLAEQTGFSDEDLGLFKKSLNEMFENDRSAARGLMAPVACIAFRHESRLGNARADQLFRRVTVRLKEPSRPPRSRDDYLIEVDRDSLPAGVTIE
ncbi:MAG: type I-C CRISPR-associated protein Cas7/Csd2, partial [Gemmatimonadota bacterium]|nr:type I-C CRISPR-associated protein Cas7/Csd2 [Gemmatimonadota bacterium]